MPAKRQRILWVDDEIDLLRSHILYLEEKGYRVTPVSNGRDALDLVSQETFDVVLLDEMMPGMGGLEVLEAIKASAPRLPVVMITKSEEENLMNEALGHKISDYLIKPVNPSQIFLACKKLFEAEDLEHGTTVRDYVRELGGLRAEPPSQLSWDGWTEHYLRSIRWDLQLDKIEEPDLRASHRTHLDDLNRGFSRYVEASYRGWLEQAPAGRPLLSPDILPQCIAPHLRDGRKVALLVVDCLRLDQWLAMEPLLPADVRVDLTPVGSILPTATAYARNAIFSGLFPRDLARTHPEFWNEVQNDNVGKNRFEEQMLTRALERLQLSPSGVHYRKIVTRGDADALTRQMGSLAARGLVALVFTFVDTFAHGRSRDAILAEFAHDVGALRAHLRTWFERSVLLAAIREMLRQGRTVVLTTDHGNIQVRRPSLVRGDRETSAGVRFKVGRALGCDPDSAVLVRDPHTFGLPAGGLLKNYIFAKEDHFFVFSRRRHDYERQIRDSFQHGGISMEEMIIPLVTLRPATDS